ncbi:LLM class flavin-dependent oxidoreductase [Streptomyces sp. NPDC046909]|uniref:LLM class flavin-dependent oxidoreductase n=1 Tax=Streptomyces sp. NPDC046909 TaxID=3155617 RepID=UPI0033C55A9F
MKFSMIFEAQTADSSPAAEQQVLRDCVEQAVLGEEMGFDRVWAVEHHALEWYAHMSAPEIFLTWVAARTSRIRIGHGVVCMPFNYNHPVRAAERAAMLDVLSGGRVDVGAGRGATLQEMALCGVDPERTYAEVDEALRLFGSAWQNETFEWHGELLDIKPPEGKYHKILPRPVQTPHPPLFLACTKRDTVKLAAEYGVGALVMGFAGPDEIRLYRKIYDEAIAARTPDTMVSTVANDSLVALCPTIVSDDAESARRYGVRGQRFFAESIAYWYGGGEPPALEFGDDPLGDLEERKQAHISRLHEAQIPVNPETAAPFNVNHAYGDAQRAIDYVQQLVDAGADEIMCLIQMGLVPHEVCMETIRQWGETVIPHFRDQQKKA